MLCSSSTEQQDEGNSLYGRLGCRLDTREITFPGTGGQLCSKGLKMSLPSSTAVAAIPRGTGQCPTTGWEQPQDIWDVSEQRFSHESI